MKKSLLLILFTVLGSTVLFTAFAHADEKNPLVQILEIFVDTQFELTEQNNVMIQQNDVIIQLLKGDKDIFVAGLTDRYMPIRWTGYGQYECYDRLLQEYEKGLCGLKNNITKDQFTSMVTGNPEN